MHAGPTVAIGHCEIIHRIGRGESISHIAGWYRRQGWPVGNWEPIWRLNTAVYQNLRDRKNPDQIFPGDVLVIPRSPAGYDELTAKLRRLLIECAADDGATADIERVQASAEKFGATIDLVADVATAGASLSLKSVELLRLAREAKTLSGTALAANRYLARKLAADMSKAVEKLAVQKAVDAVSEPAGKAVKGYESLQKSRAIRTAVRAHTILDCAEILLDWVSPSYIAKALTGFDKTMKEEREKARHAQESTLAKLAAKIQAIGRERSIVYPS